MAAKAYADSKRVQWKVYIPYKVQNKQPHGSDFKKNISILMWEQLKIDNKICKQFCSY